MTSGLYSALIPKTAPATSRHRHDRGRPRPTGRRTQLRPLLALLSAALIQSPIQQVWPTATASSITCRRIYDARLALTLRQHGVTEFATANVKDFEGFGFARVWNPLRALRLPYDPGPPRRPAEEIKLRPSPRQRTKPRRSN